MAQKLSEQTMTWAWTFLGVLLVIVTSMIWLRIASVTFFWDTNYGDAALAATSLWFCLPTLTLLLIATRNFLDDSAYGSWSARLPVAFGLRFDPRSRFGKKLQVFFLTAFLFFPLVGQVHSLAVVSKATIWDRDKQEVFSSGIIENYTTFSPLNSLFSARFRFKREEPGPKETVSCIPGPGYQQWLYLIWLTGLFAYSAKLLAVVFSPRKIPPGEMERARMIAQGLLRHHLKTFPPEGVRSESDQRFP